MLASGYAVVPTFAQTTTDIRQQIVPLDCVINSTRTGDGVVNTITPSSCLDKVKESDSDEVQRTTIAVGEDGSRQSTIYPDLVNPVAPQQQAGVREQTGDTQAAVPVSGIGQADQVVEQIASLTGTTEVAVRDTAATVVVVTAATVFMVIGVIIVTL